MSGHKCPAYKVLFLTPLLQKGLALHVTLHFSEPVIKALGQSFFLQQKEECHQSSSCWTEARLRIKQVSAKTSELFPCSGTEGWRGVQVGEMGPTGHGPFPSPAHVLPLGHLMSVSNWTRPNRTLDFPGPRPTHSCQVPHLHKRH